MSLSVNSNTAAQKSATYLNRSHEALNKSLERLSSGMKINAAADDPAGLMLSGRQYSDGLSAGQYLSNATHDISRFQTADGALGQATELMQRIRTQVVQGSSDGLSTEDRQALQKEIAGSVATLGELYEGTRYGGQSLLEGRPGLSGLANVDVSTLESSQDALKQVDEAIGETQEMRAGYAAQYNQTASEMTFRLAEMTSAFASASDIRDTDFAEESTNLKTMEALRGVGIFAMNQANANARQVMQLLG